MSQDPGNLPEGMPLSFGLPQIQQCPFAAYNKLRPDTPVYKDPLTGNYVLTRYADVRRATLDVKNLSSRTGLGSTRDTAAKEETDAIYDAKGYRPMDTLISNDPPSHRMYRQLVDKAFTPNKIDELEPHIDEIIHGLIDQFIDKPEIDFLAEFAIKLPMIVIAEQLGVDSKDMDRFKIWSDVSVESQDPTMTYEREIEVVNILTDMQQYMAAACERLRKNPDGMLLSRLVHAEVDGRQLDTPELLSILQQLIVAGNETTTTTLASGMKQMIERPELVAQLRADPSKMRQFVEETLRVMAPIQTMFRKVNEDTEIHGVKIPAGSMIEVRFGAANRDAAEFPNPDVIDLDRPNANTHLAFGVGPHLCIGNQLARGELRLAFKALIDRMDNFRASRGEDSYKYTPLYIAYGPTQLWMNFDKR
ncbi:MAG: cytochrome P450 [Caulobacterales bacterium]